MSNDNYVNVIRELPRPSDDQVKNFVAYVAHAHSWYKHLPAYPKVPFCFFLDPNAGKKMVYDQAGKIRFEDETSEEGFHYTHQTTKEYRTRFGYLNYYQGDYGTSFRLPLANGGLASTESSIGLKILDSQGETLEISSKLIKIGTAYLSAFAHRHNNFNILMRFNISRLSLESDFLETLEQAPAALSKQLRFLWAVLNTKDWYPLKNDTPMVNHEIYETVFRNIIPINKRGLEDKYLSEEDRKILLQTWETELSTLDIKQAIAILLQTWESNSTEEYKSLEEDYKEFIRDLVTANLIIHADHMRSNDKIISFYDNINNIEKFSNFARKRYPIETDLAKHLAREKIHQFDSMETAMNNFLDTVYES